MQSVLVRGPIAEFAVMVTDRLALVIPNVQKVAIACSLDL